MNDSASQYRLLQWISTAASMLRIVVRELVWTPILLPIGLSMSRVALLLARVVRPTFVPATLASRKIQPIADWKSQRHLSNWEQIVAPLDGREVDALNSVMLNVAHSDEDRARGMETKAIGMLQVAAILLAGDVGALTIGQRSDSAYESLVVALTLLSSPYLVLSVMSSLLVLKPSPRVALRPDRVLPLVQIAPYLAVAIRNNERGAVVRSNFVEAAISDAVRAASLVAAALIASLPSM